jgi:CRISPR-associated protein Cas2
MAREGNRWMWILCLFDLPVTSKVDRRLAARFRKDLLNDGYMMLQFSVYARLCNGLERAQKHTNRLKSWVPDKGSVRVMLITEQQFARMELLVGKRLPQEDTRATQLVLF